MDIDELWELKNKAEALAADVDNGKTWGNDVADKLESYAKTLLAVRPLAHIGRYCELMAKKARGE